MIHAHALARVGALCRPGEKHTPTNRITFPPPLSLSHSLFHSLCISLISPDNNGVMGYVCVVVVVVVVEKRRLHLSNGGGRQGPFNLAANWLQHRSVAKNDAYIYIYNTYIYIHTREKTEYFLGEGEWKHGFDKTRLSGVWLEK